MTFEMWLNTNPFEELKDVTQPATIQLSFREELRAITEAAWYAGYEQGKIDSDVNEAGYGTRNDEGDGIGVSNSEITGRR